MPEFTNSTQQISTADGLNTGMRDMRQPQDKPRKTVDDWVRDMRMSADVNQTTVGVPTDRVTPELLLATSGKLLRINRREEEDDKKDSLQFQRIYGPADFVAEHVLRDGGKLGRNLLWKATNRGNLDFMQTNALDQHVSDVFNGSKLANMIDGSSPLETVEASYKISRIGEGGIASQDTAPVEMRLVQPSFMGYIDPVRSVECLPSNHLVMTDLGWKKISDITTDDLVACCIDGKWEYHNPEQVVSYDYDGPLYFGDGVLNRLVHFAVTPDHRLPLLADDGTIVFRTVREIYDDDGVSDVSNVPGVSDVYLGTWRFGDKPTEPRDQWDWDDDYDYVPFVEIENYTGKVYCLTVPGGMFYTHRMDDDENLETLLPRGHWTGNSLKVGLDAYMTKNVQKGSDGKLYQTFINAHTGKPELVDSVTAAKSVVTTPDMMQAKTDHIFALGGDTGVRIVRKSDVDYYLPHMDEAFTKAANMVPGLSGVKELRLLMGCLHPLTSLVTVGPRNEVSIVPAKDVSSASGTLPGMSADGAAGMYKVSATYAKFPKNRAWFRKIVLYSGRALVTSRDHRWPVLRDGELTLVEAAALKRGDKVLRSTFRGLPTRRTFLEKVLVNRDTAVLLGYAVRSLRNPDKDKLTITYMPRHEEALFRALKRHGIEHRAYVTNAHRTVAFDGGWFHRWLKDAVGVDEETRRVPPCVLSAGMDVASMFLDAFTADENRVAMDSREFVWVLDIRSTVVRDAVAMLLARTGTDTLYRDAYVGDGRRDLALKLVDMPEKMFGDFIVDEVKSNLPTPNAAIMVDVDIDDNMYSTANGIVTHNSKYPQQAISIEGREAPLVRATDSTSGKDMATAVGKFLGARFASKPGTVSAVRHDRIDMVYDDGTKGSVPLYVDFPMNAKGYIDNKPQVKAGQHVGKGDLLASSNYTDGKGVAALGTNLRTGWISWHGGTYEDAIVISESAAKKLTSTTMYSSDLDLDKTVALGKRNYLAWKPGEYTKEQLSVLDDEGVVKPGTVLAKGDPMVLAVRTSEPSPGTMGKRLLTDLSQTWDHEYPGVVTDVLRTRKGVRVLAKVTEPAHVGDKLSGGYGNKGVVSSVLPDESMPKDKDGKPLELLFSPLGLVSRTNASQLHEALLGKVAHAAGTTERLDAFTDGNIMDQILAKLKQHHLKPDDDFFDPETGRKIPNVVNGYSYIYKLKHLADSKLDERGTGDYTADDAPGSSSKRLGMLEVSAMVGHNSFDNLIDARLIRGQANSEFWRSLRTGGIPTMPGEPLVQKKFFAHLQGSGVNVRKTPKGVSVFALSQGDVDELAGRRELKSRDTYAAKTFRPIDGGLFGQDVFGVNGDKWGYIQLDEPVPNPVMAQPLARLLRMSDKDFEAVASGASTVSGMSSSADLKERLSHIDLDAEAEQAKREFKEATPSRRDAALKRYVAIENMRRQGVRPDGYMLDRIPVLPPAFRPVTSHNGLTMVADANYLYAQLLDARDDVREAKVLPDEYKVKARQNLYRTWNELTGLYEPEDPKLKNKNVGGLLSWALGKGSPKFSALQRKVVGMSLDTVGRGAVVPNARLTIDQVGVPVDVAFGVMAPFVERSLVRRGYTPMDAMKMVKKRSPQAVDVLQEVMKTHPVLLNRAPTLHKFNIMAFEPVLVKGDAIQVNPSICPGQAMDFDGNCVDFDSKIFLKISKSSLDNTSFMHYILSDARKGCETTIAEGQDKMRIDEKQKVLVFNPHEDDKDSIYLQMRIGDFPRVGVPAKDRNGADVFGVPEGVKVLGVDPVTGRDGWYDVLSVTREEKVKTVKVSLGSKSVIVSDNESLAVFDPEQGRLTKVAPEATGGRLVPVLRCSPQPYGPFGDRDLGWLFGAYISDGWRTDRMIGYCKLEKSKRDEFVRIMRAYHDNFTVREYAEAGDGSIQKLGKSVKLHLNSQTLAKWWEQWNFIDGDRPGESGRTATVKCIDERMLNYGSEEFLWGLLSGLLDGDGTLTVNNALSKPRFGCRFSTSSQRLCEDLCTLCYRLGVRTSVTVTPPRGFSGTAYTVCPSTVDMWGQLGRLSCVGARERSLIGQWKENRPADDVNDQIPLSMDDLETLRKLSSNKGQTAPLYYATHRSSGRVPRIARCTLLKFLDMLSDVLPDLCARARAKDTIWVPVDKVEDAGDRDVFDLRVDEAKVYAVNDGVVVWDTVNIHVPVSDAARREAMNRMRPSRNLIGPANRTIMNKPEKEYIQGLYIATRMGKSPDGRARFFKSLQEAKEAYRQGIIDIDTPIQLPDNSGK